MLALVLGSGPSGPTHTTGPTVAPTHAAVAKTSSHASSSPPRTTGSPSSPPIVVTVCTVPADGCGFAGSSQYMEVRPKQITVSGDGSGYVKDLVWSSWGTGQATATGTLEIDACNPNCAQGAYTGYPATVTLAGLKPYGTGPEAYSTIVVQSPAANETYTYTRDTVP